LSTPTYYSGDIVIGSAHKPGYRARGHVDQNFVEEYPVASGQSIKAGDIVTLTASELASNFATGSTSGTYNTADLRNGVYQALNDVDNSGGSDGDQYVSVYGDGAFAELWAAAGIGAGNWVEMDINDDAATPAARTSQLAATVASASRSRVEAISAASLQPVRGATQAAGDATVINPLAYGVVGKVVRILTRDANGKKKSNTAAGDLVQVRLGRRGLP